MDTRDEARVRADERLRHAEELRELQAKLSVARSMADHYSEAWKAAEADNTALRIRLGKAETSAAKWQQAFNSLEKPVTDHIEHCIDAGTLDNAHEKVMKRFGPR